MSSHTTWRTLRRTARTAVVGGVAAALVGPAVAGAESTPSDPNPLSSNVPYLAWRGEHVRIVKCTGDLPAGDDAIIAQRSAAVGEDRLFDGLVRTDVIVEDWSGDRTFLPTPAAGTIDTFLSPDDGLCVKADVISQKAGLAMLKLLVTVDPGAADRPFVDLLTRSEVIGAHQFLAGWLNLDTPALSELPIGGDAATLNEFRAGDDPANDGVVRVQVTGTLPMGNNFAELGLGESLSLPADWPRLARALASDRNPDNAFPEFRWDIHDDQSTVEGHPFFPRPLPTTCDDRATDADLAPRRDAVDNCEGGLAFSRFFDADGPAGPLTPLLLGFTSEDTVGPFDPQRPEETLLGDGALTADDAPMPAARVDVEIAANRGGTDIGGVGSLHKTSKAGVYSRDRVATANSGSGAATPHNLYAPFYSQYIPATADGSGLLLGSPVSGTTGPAQGNNFPGFLVGDGLGGEGDLDDVDNRYDNWDIAHVFRTAIGVNTSCLRRTDQAPAYRQTPSGAQKVAVYTDEHGLAHVNYRPGTGAFYDALGAVRNSNGGCDLAGIDVLGTSQVSAVARYPYQPTTDAPKPAATTLTKTVRSRFAKFLAAFPKGTDAQSANARIIVAHAQDVDGRGFAGETVCFHNTSSQGVVEPYVYDGFNQRVYGGYDLGGARLASEQNEKQVCMTTNAAGNAAVEVLQSEGGDIDIVGQFVEERLLRDLLVDFDTNAPQTPVPAPQAPGSGNGSGTGSASNGSGTGSGSTGSGTGSGSTGGQTPVGQQTTQVPPVTAPGNTAPSAETLARIAAAIKAAQARAGAVAGATRTPTLSESQLRFARLSTSTKGRRWITLRVDGSNRRATVRITLRGRGGKVLGSVTRRVGTGRTVAVRDVRIGRSVRTVRVEVLA